MRLSTGQIKELEKEMKIMDWLFGILIFWLSINVVCSIAKLVILIGQ